MEANTYGVCIGNEAVWSGSVDAETTKRLLGMDLVRLGLERGKSARDALDVITSLLEIYGQGGPCSSTMEDLTYHNSYLIADSKEAWVLETVGKYWAAEHVEVGFRNISNCLSIGTKIDLMNPSLKEEAKKLGFWDPSQEFNFSKVFGDGDVCDRYRKGRRLLEKYSSDNQFDAAGMMTILRDKGINMGGYGGGFATTASQVSTIKSSEGANNRSCHWFTGTANAVYSIFKPFVFEQRVSASATQLTSSSGTPETRSDGKHELYRIHEALYPQIRRSLPLQKTMKELEASLLINVEMELGRLAEAAGTGTHSNISNIFNDAVAAEIKLYSGWDRV